MAKVKDSVQKISFGTKKTGAHKKHYGPKNKRPKPYNRQGR